MTSTAYITPHVVLRGSAFEIGLGYGKAVRERIVQHLHNQVSAIGALHPEDPTWWQQAARSYLSPFEDLAPHMLEEMAGIARGAGLTMDEVLLLNVRDELVVAGRSVPSEECTSFGCGGDVTLDGLPIVGQTKDTAPISADLYVVIAMYQQGRPDFLQMPYAGELGVFGLSSAGMTCFGNALYVRGRNRGRLPWTLLRRLALEAESIDSLLALVSAHGVGTPGNLTIGDKTGRVIALENTDHGFAVVEAQHGLLVHANHIVSPLSGYETYAEPERSASMKRRERLTALLEAERGRLTAPLAMRSLMDHSNYPRSICRHSSGGKDIQTTAALVAEPAAGLLHITRGQPCHGWPVTYSL